MTSQIIILLVSIALAISGLMIELLSKSRARRIIPDSGRRPYTSHRNLRVLGHFKYKPGSISYQCFCLGPLPIAPIGCYLCDSGANHAIVSAQKSVILEVCSLYLRWGWVVAFVALLVILL